MHVDRDVFKSALDAIIILDSRGLITEINPSAVKLFKKGKAKIVGRALSEFIDGNLQKNRGEVSPKGRGETLQYTKVRSTGKRGILYFFRDISDLKLEMQRREHFLSIAGHELKSPLATIKAINYLMLRRSSIQKDDFLKEQIQKVNSKADTLIRLIAELLDITKIRHKRLELTLEKVSFNKILKSVIDDFEKINKTHRVEVHNKTNVSLKLDKARIEQVILNLLKNAAKYSPGKDAIFINVEKSKKYLKCEIIDFGLGIPPEQIGKIFNLYYRLPGRERTFDGLGVGLFIASEIVKAHGGKMKVKSALNRGSQFIFYLPLTTKLNRVRYSLTV